MNREQERMKQIEIVDKFVKKGDLTEEEIVFFCLKSHGLSPNFVKKYIERSVEFGFFGRKKDGTIFEKKSVLEKDDKKVDVE